MKGVMVAPGEGKKISVTGITLFFKAVSEDTGGAWSLLEYTAPPKFSGPPPHWHKKMVEGFYVLEGTLTFRLDERTVKGDAGSFMLVPTGVVHTFSNAEETPCKFLVFVSPGGLERYFEELAELIKNEPAWPPADMSKVVALSRNYDTHFPPRG